MTLLYIEDDQLDKRNMDWVFSNMENSDSFKVIHVSNFDEAINISKSTSIDLIITDQSIGEQNYAEVAYFLKDYPYYVLTNNVNPNIKAKYPPKAFFTKPFIKDNLLQILNIKEKPNQINLDYFKQFSTSPQLKKEMLEIVYKEFKNALTQIDVLKKTPKDLAALLHKLCSKFSILGMNQTYKLVKSTENKIIEKQNTEDLPLKEIQTQLKEGLIFLDKNLNLKI